MNDSLQSKTIQWMRFPLAVAIVFLHCSSPACEENAIYTFVRQYISCTLAGVAVPIFFFISGFLFFLNVNKLSTEIYFKKIKNRVQSLLIPYLFWNFLCALIPFLILVAIVIKNHEPISWLMDYVRDLRGWHIFWDYNQWGCGSTGPIDLPLWFVRDLIVFALITPLIYYLCQKIRYWFIFVLVFLYLLDYWLNIPLNIRAVLFFSLGAYLSLEKYNLVSIASHCGKLSLILTVLYSIIATVFSFDGIIGECLYQAFVIFVLISIFYIGTIIIQSGRGKCLLFLSQCSFFVYAAHEVKVYEISAFMADYLFFGETTMSRLCHYFAYPILTILLCIGLYFFCKQFMPKSHRLLTGNRK